MQNRAVLPGATSAVVYQLEHRPRPATQWSDLGRWSHHQGCRLPETGSSFCLRLSQAHGKCPWSESSTWAQSQGPPKYTSWRLHPHSEPHHPLKNLSKERQKHGSHTCWSSEGRIWNWGWRGPHGEVYSSYSGASVWLIQRKSPTSNTDLGCLHRCVCVFTEFYLPHLPHSFFYLIMSQSTESYSSHTMSTVKIEDNNVSYRLF